MLCYVLMWFGIGQLNSNLSWWRHQMETFSALLAICAGKSPVPGESPAQRPVTQRFHVSLICAWINRWVNNREAGDLRRYRAHYDVIVMSIYIYSSCYYHHQLGSIHLSHCYHIFPWLCAWDVWCPLYAFLYSIQCYEDLKLYNYEAWCFVAYIYVHICSHVKVYVQISSCKWHLG